MDEESATLNAEETEDGRHGEGGEVLDRIDDKMGSARRATGFTSSSRTGHFRSAQTRDNLLPQPDAERPQS